MKLSPASSQLTMSLVVASLTMLNVLRMKPLMPLSLSSGEVEAAYDGGGGRDGGDDIGEALEVEAVDSAWVIPGGGGGDTVSSDWCDSGGEGVESLLSGDEPPLNGDTRPRVVLRRKGDEVLTDVEAIERLVDSDECGDESGLLTSDVSRFTRAVSAKLSECCDVMNEDMTEQDCTR